MKTNRYLALLTLFCVPISCATPDLVIETNCGIIGPFNINDSDYEYSWSYKSNHMLKGAKERISLGIKGEDYTYFQTSAFHFVEPSTVYDVTFNLPIYDYLTNKGIYAKIEILNSVSNPLKTFTFELKPPQKQKINVKDYLRDYYVVHDVIVDPDNYEAEPSEKFCFSGFVDYFNVDYYYRLDLSFLYINYWGLKDFETADGNLIFYDYDDIFPYISGTSPKKRMEIPVKALKNGEKIIIKYAKMMYVNEKTLEMSLQPEVGFISTKHFYLPINKSTQLLDQKFTLSFESFGFGQSNFTWDMRYTNNRDLIGDCHNSEYCVQGEIKA